MREPGVVVLHIGQHKTGSTALQRYLGGGGRLLRRAGFVYPTSGRFRGHHGMIPAALAPHLASVTEVPRVASPQDLAAELFREVPPGLTPILSSEAWWRLLADAPERFDRGVEELSRYYRVQLICFRRPAQSKSWSAIKHQARLGRSLPVVRAVANDMAKDHQAWLRLTTTHANATVIPYTGGDSAQAFLERLQPLTHGRARRLALDAAIARRRGRGMIRTRRNADFAHGAAPAVTLGFSQALWGHAEPSLRDAAIAGFLATTLAEVPDAAALRQLPPDRILRDRVVSARPSPDGEDLATLLLEPERAALSQYLARPDVHRIAQRTGAADAVAIVCEVLAARPPARPGDHRLP